MAQLFQPTNMIPNLVGPIGTGVADVSKPVTISWQINGTAGMTKYRIRCYANAQGIIGTHDETKTLITPFYGRDSNGNIQRYSHEIAEPWRFWENGKTCTYEITMWWGENESVTTLSKCVFLSRGEPSLTLSVDSPVTEMKDTFTAFYSQPEGDGPMWVRWQLADNSAGTYDIVDDTGQLYGATPTLGGALTYSYDGLIDQTFYAVRCSVQTENGVLADTGWKQFEVAYGNLTEAYGIETENSCTDRGAISVSWPAYSYIPRSEASGSGSIVGNQIVMSTGDSMTWSSQDDGSLTIPPPWSLIYRGKFPSQMGGAVVLIFQEDNNLHNLQITFRSDAYGRGIDIDYNIVDPINTIGIASVRGLSAGSDFAFAISSTNLYLYSNGRQWDVDFTQRSFSVQSIKKIRLSGTQNTSLVKVLSGDINQSEFLSEYAKPGIAEIGGWTGGTWFRLYALNGFYAGANTAGGTYVKGYSLYRVDDASNTMKKIVENTTSVISIADYSAGNTDETVSYELFETMSDGEVRRIVSAKLEPCYWAWVLLSCSKNNNGEYIVEKAYIFQNNVASGTMSNNNRPSVLDNFTRYPFVQMANNNYKSGTLQALIGSVSGCQAEYKDTTVLRNEIMSLSTTTNYLFLKDRKGDLMMVRPAGEITMETGDNTREQEQTVSFPWVEVGSAKGVSVYGIG